MNSGGTIYWQSKFRCLPCVVSGTTHRTSLITVYQKSQTNHSMSVDIKSQSGAEWDEPRIQSTLNRLQNMHVQVGLSGASVPRLMLNVVVPSFRICGVQFHWS